MNKTFIKREGGQYKIEQELSSSDKELSSSDSTKLAKRHTNIGIKSE